MPTNQFLALVAAMFSAPCQKSNASDMKCSKPRSQADALNTKRASSLRIALSAAIIFACLTVFPGYPGIVGYALAADGSDAPVPLLEKGKPSVDWWFVFKFNASVFPGCGSNSQNERQCVFDTSSMAPPEYRFGQQFVFATQKNPTLEQGTGCAGQTLKDPLGATFDQVYNGSYNYVVWNDQPYGDPQLDQCSENCGAPWAHSKGMLAWNDAGEGFILQVSTPSWPESGSHEFPRMKASNTLGCIAKPDNVILSQHFFALKLDKDDLPKVLKALQRARVATEGGEKYRSIVRNGGPVEVQALVKTLHTEVTDKEYMRVMLSSGVTLIAKPSRLHVPPWQLVSAILDGVSLTVASYWNPKKIPTTKNAGKPGCWDASLDSLGTPGPVENTVEGTWDQKTFKLNTGGNHAKIGVSTSGTHHYVIFGDMNQEGALSGDAKKCGSAQNGRGGLFFVVDDKDLAASVKDLITIH